MLILPDVVVTSRLVLRRWVRDDTAALGSAIAESIDHLRPWMPWIGSEPLSPPQREALIDEWERDWRNGGDIVFGMFADSIVVGGCGLHRRAGPDTLEIGYWVHTSYTGRGYAREAAAQLTSVALSLPGIARVEIHHDAANLASRWIPESLKFRFDGERPDEPVAPGELGINVAWSATESDWTRPNE